MIEVRLREIRVGILLLMGCGLAQALPETAHPPRVAPFAFDFAQGAQGWTAGFSDYPPGQEEFFELRAESRPAPVRGTGSLYISGNNHSDDLFMCFKREVTGLRPDTLYRVSFVVEIATNIPRNCAGIGGAPGESVVVKAGAAPVEPVNVVDEEGMNRLNVDVGGQMVSGPSALVLGNVANSRQCGRPERYELKRLRSRGAGLRVRTSPTGSAWLFFGTDSGFEGTTSLFYTHFAATFRLPPSSETGATAARL